MSKQKQPVVLITAAGRGMGAAIAQELHRQGWRLALMSPSDNAYHLAKSLDGVGVRGVMESVTDLENLVNTAVTAYGRIDAVVTHTGHPPKGDLLEINEEDWLRGHEMILLPLMRLGRMVTPLMQQQGKGVWLNITTFAAFEPTLKFPVSCIYRSAVGTYTKLYADRYAADNIRMNALLPGYIDSLNHTEETVATIPMARIGQMAEVAQTAAFLLSDAAGYITGQNIRIDGGVTRHV